MRAYVSAAFVSYSRADSEFALRLVRDLRAAGAHVWLDQLDIEAGVQWDECIEAALGVATRLIVVLSPSSASSSNVRNEITYALDEKKAIVPILYQDCNVPLQLRRMQHVDFRRDYAAGLKALCRALGVRSGLAEAPVPSSATPPSFDPPSVLGAEVRLPPKETELTPAPVGLLDSIKLPVFTSEEVTSGLKIVGKSVAILAVGLCILFVLVVLAFFTFGAGSKRGLFISGVLLCGFVALVVRGIRRYKF